MINSDDVVKENIIEHNPDWPKVHNHPYKILIIGSYWSGKRNSLIYLINEGPGIDKIYLSAKNPFEAKRQFLIKKREDVWIKHFIAKLLLNTPIISMISIKTLKNIMQIRNVKY